MLFSSILKINFHDLFYERISFRTFQNFKELVICITNLANDWAKNNSSEVRLDPDATHSIIHRFTIVNSRL